MDAYLIFLFALPIVSLLTIIILTSRTPTDYSAHSHLSAPHHPTGPHR
jgi:hypothetical protein